MRFFRSVLFCGIAVVFFGNFAGAQSELKRFSFREPQMGTLMEIILYAENEEEAEEAAGAGFKRIAELNSILSDYDRESELMRLLRKPVGNPVKVSDDLFAVFEYAESISRRTGGAFDVTVGPLSHLWREARREKKLPDQEDIAEMRERVGFALVQLDRDARTVALLRANMQIDFGGIAKGFAADEALRVLRERGFSRAMVAAAGDIALGESPPGEDGWKIGVDSINRSRSQISQIVSLRNCAISTSGDTEQFIEIGGKRYSHILDPRTGVGLEERISVTVIGPRGILTDSLATAVSVLGVEKGITLIDSISDVEVRIVAIRDGRIRTFRSENFPE